MRALVLLVAVVLIAGGCVRHGQRCGEASAALARLGGCGMDLRTFVADCRAVAEAEAEDGPEVDLSCIERATTCEEAEACQ